jgi:hypothetical protein
MYVRQLFVGFCRVKLDSLEARLRPFEQLDKRTPRGKSRLGADHQGCVIDQFKVIEYGTEGRLNIKNNWMKNIVWRAASF